MRSIAIIGGGITGLTAAYQLKKNGCSVHLFEEKSRTGGVVGSTRENGFLVEAGPHSLIEKGREIPALIDDLGIAGRKVFPNPGARNRFIIRDGRLIALPTSPGSLVRSPLFSKRGKARALLEPLVRQRAAESTDEETLASFITRRLGSEILDYAVNPFVGGILAGDPANLSVRHAFPFFPRMEREHGSLLVGAIKQRRKKAAAASTGPRLFSFDEGLGTFTDALTATLEGDVSLNARVERFSRNGSYKIHWQKNGDHFSKNFNAVMIAAPAHRIPGLADLSGAEPMLERLRDFPYAPLSLLTLGYRRDDVEHPLNGFGALAPEKEQLPFLGLGFASSTFANRAPAGHVSITVYIGGARQPEQAAFPESSQLSRVLPVLEQLLGITGKPVFRSHRFLPRAIPQYNLGHDDYLNLLAGFERKNPGLYLAGNYRNGISLGECIQAGFKAADRVLVEEF